MSQLDAIAASDLAATLTLTGVAMTHVRGGTSTALVGTVSQRSLDAQGVGLAGGMKRSITGAIDDRWIIEAPADVAGQSAAERLATVENGDRFVVPGASVNDPGNSTVTLMVRGVPELVGGRWVVEVGR